MEDYEDLPANYNYIAVSAADNRTFRIKEVKDKESAEEWLNAYKLFSKTTWRVERTYKASGKFIFFKRDYRCCHFTDRRAKGIRSSKHTGCPAKLKVVVQRFIENADNPDLATKTHPCIVTMKDTHNHAVNSAAALKYRDLCQETRQTFIDLFHGGNNASSALKCYKTDLMNEKGENYYKAAADGMLMPSYSTVAKLFDKEFVNAHGSIAGDGMFETLKVLLQDYTDNKGGKASFQHISDAYYFVVICTPMMLRTHEKIIQSSEVVMLDASGGVDKQRHRIYFFVTPCVAGSLPLGVIVTNSEKGEVFMEALQSYKSLLPPSAFYYNEYPQVFLTDNDLKEISAIKKIYPESKTLLCQFHMLKAFWSWVCNSKHCISKDHRQELYFLYHKLLYSEESIIAKQNLHSLVDCAGSHSYDNLIVHITDMMKIKEKWMTCYRHNLPLRGSNTTNYVEVVFKVLKDCVLERTMAYNLTQLVDYIITRFDRYMYQRLIDFINGRHGSSLYRHQVLLKKMEKKAEIENFKVNKRFTSGIYEIYNNKDYRTVYIVDIARGLCTCKRGSCGKLCVHAVAVLKAIEETVHTGFNFLGYKTKEDIFYITEGKLPDANWFLPLIENDHKNSEACDNRMPVNTDPRIADMMDSINNEDIESDDCSTSTEVVLLPL